MKRLFLIPDTQTNTISYYHLLCFLIALPFDRFYSQLVLISLIIHTLIHLRRERLKLLLTKEVLIVSALYFVSLICIIYSFNKKQGWSDSTIQLALLLFPVILSLNGLDLKKYRWPLLEIFGLTVALVVIYLYADALLTIRYYHLPYGTLFTASFMNHNFAEPIGMHATYLSMYVAFSASVCILRLLKAEAMLKRILYGCCAIVLMAGLLQLSSRAVCFAMVLILLLGFPLFLFTAKRKLIFIGIAAMGLTLVSFTVFHVDTFKERYASELKKDLSPSIQNIGATEPRMIRWKVAMELVRQSPIVGYGSGTEIELLKEKYFERKLFSAYLNRFNAHNEYISLMLKTGIQGLLVYLFVLVYGLITAWQKRDVLFATFMILLIVASISENILDLNKGIFFYSFFFMFFLLIHRKDAIPPAR